MPSVTPVVNSLPIYESALVPALMDADRENCWIDRCLHLDGFIAPTWLMRPSVVVRGRFELWNQTGGMWWLGPGDALGFPHWPFVPPQWQGKAHQSLVIDVLPGNAYERLVRTSPALTLHWFELIARQISRMEKLAKLKSGVINPQQLLRIFQAMEQQYGKDQQGFLDLKANITDWSVYLGLSLSTLRRNLDRLESQGLLRRERNRIQLSNE